MFHKYRMVTNGKKFKIQERKLFFWWEDKSFKDKHNHTFSIVEFDDELLARGAMLAIDKNNGWQPIPRYNH